MDNIDCICNCITQNIDALAFSSAHFGSGTGDIFLDNVGCSGTESSLLDCSYVSGNSISCTYGHNEDVGVRCQGISHHSIHKHYYLLLSHS